MNGSDFVRAADGQPQITPCGEFPHADTGVVQVIDRAACDAMAAEFKAIQCIKRTQGRGAASDST